MAQNNIIKKLAQSINGAAQSIRLGIYKLILKSKSNLWGNIQTQTEAFEKATVDEKNAMYLVAFNDLFTVHTLAVLWLEVKNPAKRGSVYVSAMKFLSDYKELHELRKEIERVKAQANEWAKAHNKKWEAKMQQAYKAGAASVKTTLVQQATPVQNMPEENEENVIVVKGTATPVSKAC